MIEKEDNGFKKYYFEEGDEVVAAYSSPKEFKTENMKFPSYTLGVLKDGTQIYVNLTPAQFKMLNEKGDIKDKTLTCRTYKNSYGSDSIAVDVEGENKTEVKTTGTYPVEDFCKKYIKKIQKDSEFSEEQSIFHFVYWYAKVSEHKSKVAMLTTKILDELIQVYEKEIHCDLEWTI